MLLWDALDQLIDRYYQQPRVDGKTGRAITGVQNPGLYRVHVNHFKRFWGGHVLLRNVTVDEIEDYRDHRLDEKVAIETVNRELTTLRAMLRRAEIKDWIVVNPFSKAERGQLISVAEEEPPEVVLEPEEEWKLLDWAERDSKEFFALVVGALDLGARRGELLKRFSWSMVDFDAGIIRRLTSFKGGRGKFRKRNVGMSDRVGRALLDLRESSEASLTGDTPVFAFTNFRKRWEAIRTNAKLQHVTFNVLRHTFVTRLSTEEERAMIGKLVGHSNAKTTDRYFNPTDEQLLNAAAKVNQWQAVHPRPAGYSSFDDEVVVQEMVGVN